jgi:hypothetical protein
MLSPADTKDNSIKTINNSIQNTKFFKTESHVDKSHVTSTEECDVRFQVALAYENSDVKSVPHNGCGRAWRIVYLFGVNCADFRINPLKPSG